MQIFLLKLYDKIKSFKNLGTDEAKYAFLIGRAPHIAKFAYLHAIYKQIENREILVIEREVGPIPKEYVNFLKVCNGLSIFNNSLALYGYRFNYLRDLQNIWQPFDLIELNKNERPYDSNKNFFFIGSYRADGSLVYINCINHKVIRCSHDSSEPLNVWTDLEEMVLEEIDRIKLLFNSKGIKLDENKSTAPPE